MSKKSTHTKKSSSSKKDTTKKGFLRTWGKTIIMGSLLLIIVIVLLVSRNTNINGAKSIPENIMDLFGLEERYQQAVAENEEKMEQYRNECEQEFLDSHPDCPENITTRDEYMEWKKEQSNLRFELQKEMSSIRSEKNRLEAQLDYLDAIGDYETWQSYTNRIAELNVSLDDLQSQIDALG